MRKILIINLATDYKQYKHNHNTRCMKLQIDVDRTQVCVCLQWQIIFLRSLDGPSDI